ncbi:hypothetical protein ACFQ0Q_49120 [Streptomyces aureus]
MVLGFHDPVSAQVGGEFGRFRLVGVEAGDRVDGLAGFLPAGCFAAAVDAEGELRVGEGDAAEVVGDGESLDRAGLATAVSLFEAVCWMATACQSRPSSWAQAVG